MPANLATYMYICSWPEEGHELAASLSIKIWCSSDVKNVNLFPSEWRKTPRRACFIQTGMAWWDSASYWRKQSSWLITRFPFHWISCPVQACSANTVTCRSNFCEQTQRPTTMFPATRKRKYGSHNAFVLVYKLLFGFGYIESISYNVHYVTAHGVHMHWFL